MIFNASVIAYMSVGDTTFAHAVIPHDFIWYFMAILALREILFGKWHPITILGLVVFAALGVAAWMAQWRLFTMLCLFAFCARDADFRSLAKVSFVVSLVILVGICAAALSGALPDFVAEAEWGHAFDRYYLGFKHPNGCGLLAFTVVIALLVARGRQLRILEAVLLTVFLLSMYILVGSRTMLACGLLVVLGGIIAAKWTAPGWFRTLGKVIWTAFPALCATGIIALCICFDPSVAWMAHANDALTGRIDFGNQAITACGLHLLPTQTTLPTYEFQTQTPDGNLTTVTGPIPVDCHYIVAALHLGIPLTALYIIMLCILGYRSWNCENPQIAVVVMALFLYLIMETTAFLPCRDPLAVMLGIAVAYPGSLAVLSKGRGKHHGTRG